MKNLPQLEIINLFEYQDGKLLWRKSPNDGKPELVGLEAGSVNRNGYRVIGYGYKRYLAHRLVWAYFTGEWPRAVDHHNGNTEDNRIENLRAASMLENNRNTRVRTQSKSGYKGVSFQGPKWEARIAVEGRRITIGYFETAEEAAHAYDHAATLHFGEFARLNFPND